MPSRLPGIPSPIITTFLTSHTHPLPPSLFPQDPISLTCPICTQPYSPPDPSYVHPTPAGTPEYAVQISGCGACAHVFGRHCVERHLRARQPWSRACPLCRAEWIPTPGGGRREVLEAVERALALVARMDRDVGGVEAVEEGLERAREVLYRNRPI